METRQGWDGGLGSHAFAQLIVRLAALVLAIATAQTCRKYVSLVQELRWAIEKDMEKDGEDRCPMNFCSYIMWYLV